MAVGELLLGLVVTLAAGLGSSAPVAAWIRTREARYLVVAAAFLGMVAFGVLAVYGNAAAHPPAYSRVPTVPLALIAVVTALLLAANVVPRGR